MNENSHENNFHDLDSLNQILSSKGENSSKLIDILQQSILVQQQEINVLAMSIRNLTDKIETQSNSNNTPLLSEIIQRLDRLYDEQGIFSEILKTEGPQNYLPAIGTQFNTFQERQVRIEKILIQQHRFISKHLHWKRIIGYFAASNLMIACLVVLGLRLFPSTSESLVDNKLNVIFQRIELMRKANNR
jgi:hypothetical protein